MVSLPSAARVSGNEPLAESVRHFWWVVLATVRTYNLQFASNTIQLVRGPSGAVLEFIAIMLVYRISGQTAVAEQDVLGFLLAGQLAVYAWGATVWACGFGLSMEAHTGTLGPMFASPANRLAVVTGYGVGNFAWSLPSILSLLIVGLAFGAEFHVANVALAIVALGTVYLSALAIGIACGGLFILSRQANSLANFLQTPIHLLAGFYFPRSVLPDWLEPLGAVLPIAHAVDALRAAVLDGAGWQEVAPDLAATIGGCAVFVAIGILSMRRVEHAVRRSGDLNLF
jgi:ABC-2 type transport system permease protein